MDLAKVEAKVPKNFSVTRGFGVAPFVFVLSFSLHFEICFAVF